MTWGSPAHLFMISCADTGKLSPCKSSFTSK
uniref:Uncharacterized protein n=1 Tax=Arundo donax TaxID=35708 RepID=A0A0A8YR19_ARUDO